ncbi:MAG: hypothetical protein JOZ28_10185 [Candidatus Eremiobacteraeota bacterium]|nr:hypothetical protein [Candidatus Eremiobacteraeota bacterium]MBV8671725.1 hypothetical protein [Candidatus Eremiobacteraeota bacterium]
MPDAIDTSGLPAALPLPIDITVRNAEQGVNQTGKAARLDTNGVLASFPFEVKENTILFTTLDMRSIKATARGLIKVRSLRSMGEGGGYEVLADFLELSDDARQKIERLLGRHTEDVPAPVAPPTAPTFQPQSTFRAAGAATFLPPVDYQAVNQQTERRQYFEPAPLRGVSKATTATKFWGSLGVSAYVLVALAIIAIFPKGRALEMYLWSHVWWAVSRTWYWANHIGDVKLWGQSPDN